MTQSTVESGFDLIASASFSVEHNRLRISRSNASMAIAPRAVPDDPLAWLTDVLARLQDHPARPIDQLLPCNWRHHEKKVAV